MTLLNTENCRCPCHRDKSIKHVMACCYTCPKCHQRIKTHSYDDHVRLCGATPLSPEMRRALGKPAEESDNDD